MSCLRSWVHDIIIAHSALDRAMLNRTTFLMYSSCDAVMFCMSQLQKVKIPTHQHWKCRVSTFETPTAIRGHKQLKIHLENSCQQAKFTNIMHYIYSNRHTHFISHPNKCSIAWANHSIDSPHIYAITFDRISSSSSSSSQSVLLCSSI